ncbi:Uncharacterized protein APZ42_029270 [Daphnia magna]|uniref:Uncharacterized protein n=1 Tax=Daphnia magna TaxID=35525 RepID=A0A162D5A4_9CRUS|nr:Uncharacterized protein APZ42_029270 [Daphnia magna]
MREGIDQYYTLVSAERAMNDEDRRNQVDETVHMFDNDRRRFIPATRVTYF